MFSIIPFGVLKVLIPAHPVKVPLHSRKEALKRAFTAGSFWEPIVSVDINGESLMMLYLLVEYVFQLCVRRLIRHVIKERCPAVLELLQRLDVLAEDFQPH